MSVIDEIGIEVKLLKNFPVVRETLERMGFKDEKKKIFFPSCYCIETEDEDVFKVVHFKELFLLEGKHSTYGQLDELRRNTIVYLLVKWGIVETNDEIESILQDKIHILAHGEKNDYRIKHKFIKTRKLNGKMI
jgi:hypothetical protein